MDRAQPLLEVRNVSKYFGNVIALKDISVAVGAGEVTCVLGDNGAGKSTFIKILSGVHQPRRGRAARRRRARRTSPPRATRKERGIATVFQDLATVPLMSIWRNFFLGSEPTKGAGPLRRIDVAWRRRRWRAEMHKMGIDVRDPDQPVGTLSGGERQAVAIARAVYFGAKVLILDEPTSALGVKQSGVVLRYVAQARDRGLGVIFITHNPHHAYPVGDRFVILNRGRLMGTWRKGEISRDELIQQMSGGAELEALEHELQRRPAGMSAHADDRAPRHRAARRRIGVGVIGFGWLGQAHSRSMLRIPTLFPERDFDTELVVCGDTVPERVDDAVRSFGFARGDRRLARGDRRPGGRRRRDRRAEHAARRAGRGGRRGRQARVLREAGRRHAGADRARGAGRARRRRDHAASATTTAGRRSCATRAQLIADGRSARSPTTAAASSRCTARDPLGVLSWRFLVDQAGYGVTTDLMSHSVDLAHMLLGPITRVVGTTETFITRAAAARRGAAATTAAARPGDPDRRGHQRGLRRDAVRVRRRRARHVRGEPLDRRPGEPDGVRRLRHPGRAGLEPRAAQRAAALPRRGRAATRATGRCSAATASPTTATSCRAARTAIGFEDLVVIEDYEFCRSVAEGRAARAGLRRRASSGSASRPRCCARREPGAGRTSSRCGRTDGRRPRPPPLRIGVIGVGRIGRMHAELLARQVPGAAVAAVYDAYADARARSAAALGVPSAAIVDEMLDAPDVDAVAICSPHRHARRPDRRRRARPARRSSARSRCRSTSPRSTARSPPSTPPACRSRSASTAASTPRTRRWRDAVAAGEIGEPQLVRISSRDPAPPPLEYVRVSGGLFLDMTIHDFDMARFVTGSEVVEVFARGAVRIDPAFAEAGDVDTARRHARARERLPDRRSTTRARPSTATTSASRCSARRDGGVREPARAHRRSCAPPTARGARRRCRTSSSSATSRATCASGRRSSTPSRRAAPPVGARDARAPLVIGLAAWRSLREGRPVRVEEVAA